MFTWVSTENAGFRHYVKKINKIAILSREEELRLARKAKAGNPEAAHALIGAHLRYVPPMAARYARYGFRLADLVGEGNLGLLEAIERFEPQRGYRFITYAGYWVRAFILGHVLRQWSLVGSGTGPLQSRLFFRLGRERARLMARLGDWDTATTRLARKFGTTRGRILEMEHRLAGRDVSLDVPLYEGSDETRLDYLRDDGVTAEDRVSDHEERHMTRRRVFRALQSLDPRETMIVRRRLMSEEPSTLAQLGSELHLSRERVRQLEARARKKLKTALLAQAA